MLDTLEFLYSLTWVNEEAPLLTSNNECNVGFIWNYEHIENSLKDSVAEFTGTMKGLMMCPDGKLIQPTNKKFRS